MSNGKRVPTPLKYRWRRFRYNALPVVSFAVCLGVTLWLWDKQGQKPNVIGEVEALRLPVAAGTDGKLVTVSGDPAQYWTRFDRVEQNGLIARLDDERAQAALRTLRLELARVGKDLEAESVRIRLQEAGRQRDEFRQRARLAVEAEQRHLDVLDRKVQIQGDQIALQRLNATLEFFQSDAARGVVVPYEIRDSQLQRDELSTRIDENNVAMDEAEQQRAKAQQRQREYLDQLKTRIQERTKVLEEAERRWMEALREAEQRQTATNLTGNESSPSGADELTKLLAPFRAAIATQENRIDELELEIKALEIRAPITGTICAIYCWPGQYVRAGDPIMTIAEDKSRYAVAYVRQEQRIQPEVGMPVQVRLRVPGSRPEEVTIKEVGPQYEEVPPHLLRDPRVPEWALPVLIGLPKPERFPVRPGELIDIRFKPRAKERAG